MHYRVGKKQACPELGADKDTAALGRYSRLDTAVLGRFASAGKVYSIQADQTAAIEKITISWGWHLTNPALINKIC